MRVSSRKESEVPLSEEERRRAAWDNADLTTDEYLRRDDAGRLIAWDQFNRPGSYGWIITYNGSLEEDGVEDPAKLRARHWHCQGIDPYTASLMSNP